MKSWQAFCMERNNSWFSPGRILALCGVLFGLSVVLSLGFGAAWITPYEMWQAVLEPDSVNARILLHVRLPRTLGAVLAGAGLAVAGVIIQSVLNNPMASPSIIGVNAGAGLAAALCCGLFPAVPLITTAAAFAGALLAVLLVYGIAQKTGASRITLILAGVAVNSFLNAGTDTVTTLIPDALIGSAAFRLGGLAGVSLRLLRPAAAFIVLGVGAAFLLRHELDILALGESTAKSLGMPVELCRFLLLMVAAALAGASVSFAGLLGFVGLIVPHMARFFVGNESRFLIPLSALVGGGFLTLCDLLSRLIFSPYEVPVGIFMSFLGAPFFIWLLLRQRGGRRHD